MRVVPRQGVNSAVMVCLQQRWQQVAVIHERRACRSDCVVTRSCCCLLQAINNPKGRTPGSSSDTSSLTGSSLSGSGKGSEGLRRGTKPGEGAVREVAAYVLDYDHFSGVPPTALVSAYVSEDTNTGTGGAVKVGSLQQFVESEGDCEERGE